MEICSVFSWSIEWLRENIFFLESWELALICLFFYYFLYCVEKKTSKLFQILFGNWGDHYRDIHSNYPLRFFWFSLTFVSVDGTGKIFSPTSLVGAIIKLHSSINQTLAGREIVWFRYFYCKTPMYFNAQRIWSSNFFFSSILFHSLCNCKKSELNFLNMFLLLLNYTN